MVKRTIRIIEFITDAISGELTAWIIFVLMLMVMVEAIARYGFAMGFGVSDEIGGFMLVTITFLGLAYALKEKAHVRIDFVVDRLPARARNWLRVVTLAIGTAFVPVLIWGSYYQVQYSHKFHMRSLSWMRIPLEWPQMFMLIGAILLLFQFIPELVKALRATRTTGEKPQ